MFKFKRLNPIPSFSGLDDGGSLLDLDLGGGGLPSDNSQTGPQPQAAKPNKEVEELNARLKDAQEKIRQQGEELKDMKEFKKRLIGDPEEEKRLVAEKEMQMRMTEDPIGTTQELISKALEERSKKEQEGNKALADRLDKLQIDGMMDEIQQEYEVDWEKDGQKILDQMKYFDPSVKKGKPKEALLAAMKLAGVFQKRESAPFVQGGRGGQFPTRQTDEAQKIKDRIFSPKKSKGPANVFGI